MAPKVLVNSNQNIAFELDRTAKHVRCLMTLESGTRDVRNQPVTWTETIGSGASKRILIQHFDKEWRQLPVNGGTVPYPVVKAALTWLKSPYHPLTERAKKEIAMLIVTSEEFKFIAKFADDQEQVALNAAPVGSLLFKTIEELQNRLTEKELIVLWNSIAPETEHINGRFKPGKAALVQKIWEKAEQIQQQAPAKPAKNNSGTAGEGVKKVGIKKQIREMLEAGEAHSLEELVAKFGEEKKTSITTALSDLRSEKYCGEGGPLNIVRDANKRYHIEGVEPKAASAATEEAPAES